MNLIDMWTWEYHLAVVSFDRVLLHLFMALHHPTFHPYRKAWSLGYASEKLPKCRQFS